MNSRALLPTAPRYRRLLRLSAVLTLMCGVPAGIAEAAPDREKKLDGATAQFKWDGPAATGANIGYDSGLKGPCDKRTPGTYCDQTLINVDVADGAGVTLTMVVDEAGDEDFDIFLYKSDAAGTAGTLVMNSAKGAPSAETVTATSAKGYYLLHVVYFQTLEAGYKGTATVTGAPAPAPTPDPGGEPTPTPAPTPAPTATPEPGPSPSDGQPAPSGAAPQPTPAPAGSPLRADFIARMTLRKTRTRAARRSGLTARLSCSENCEVRVSARISARTARKLRLGRKARTLGSSHITLSPEAVGRYRIGIRPSVRRRLRKGTSIRVGAVITDTDGQRRKQITRRVTLR